MSRMGLVPDLTILLDCDVDLGLARARGNDRFHQEERHFHQRVREGFLALAAEDPQRFELVDASQLASQVLAETRSLIMSRLEPR